MNNKNNCPKCNSEYIYQDGDFWICPECAHEWVPHKIVQAVEQETEDQSIRDANGNLLEDGDAVTVIKDLKIKGSSNIVKGGTKIKKIRLIDSSDGHNIACKIDGFGAINLKSEFVKKV